MNLSPETLLRSALAAHDCQTGTLHVLDPGTGLLRLATHVGLPPQVAAIVATVPVGKGMAGLAAERGEPVQTCNLQADTSGDIRPAARAVPVQASVAVPMLLDRRLCGVLGFAKADYHEWSETELAALQATAADVARHLLTAPGPQKGVRRRFLTRQESPPDPFLPDGREKSRDEC